MTGFAQKPYPRYLELDVPEIGALTLMEALLDKRGRMRARTRINEINAVPDGWVRVDSIRRVRTGLELTFAVHRGKRGRRVSTWLVQCDGVRESHLCDLNGGGLRLYPPSHPAARQFVAARAELHAAALDELSRAIGALLRAHVMLTDDWVPFDRYISEDLYRAKGESKGKVVLRGPDFLMRSYAKALRRIGVPAQLSVKGRPKERTRPSVLHFGDSYIVAERFSVQEVQRPVG